MGSTTGWTLGELAGIFGGTVRGDSSKEITRPVPAGSNDTEGLTFAESPKYLTKVLESQVGAVIVDQNAPAFDLPAILVPVPRLAFFQFLKMAEKVPTLDPGVHATAVVHPSVNISATAKIGANSVIESDCEIGDDVEIFPLVYVGPRCKISKGCRLMPGAILVQDVTLGPNSTVMSGAVLGSDGFGFVWDGQNQVKVPQVGKVVVGSHVEIGANSTIDRATSGETVIGNGVKFDDLVHVGHNSKIGDHSVFAGLVGISGSVEIGDRVIVGGQAGFADHVSCASDVVLAGRTGLMRDLNEPGEYFGVPPTPIKAALRSIALYQKLPELLERIKRLESELEKLKNGS